VTQIGRETTPIANVLLPDPLYTFRVRDASASHLQVAIAPTGDSVRILDLEPEHPTAAPLEGDPTELLKEWQRKLGLRITPAGTIEAVQ
ncbi:MAG TPA: hypothetical protein VFU03_03235, partial [Gemmatimonadales bacterium]|nr:hypothetical protein [Gemmatimonadales bacterium]